MTIRTIKIPYSCSDLNYWAEYAQLNREQANITRFAFNRFKEGLKEKDIRLLLKSLNNITQDTWFQQSAIRAASDLYDACVKRKQTKVQFGKNSFSDYKNNKITKKDLQEVRTFGISSIGEAPQKGNRKFNFVSLTEIQFKPQVKTKYKLSINPSKNQKQYIKAIIDLSNAKAAPITVRLTKTHLHLSFDVQSMQDKNYKPKANRVMGIDMNPNRFAYVIKDQNRLLKSESFDLMELRLHTRKGFSSDSKEKKYLNNKKRHEIIELAHEFIKQAKTLHCECIALENLNGMKSQGKNKHFNRSVNNDFKRKLFRDTIEKLCAIHNLKLIEVLSPYTSFMGCVLYGDILPDPSSAAACIADAGLIHLQKGTKYLAWFKHLVIDPSLYNKSKYLHQWKKEDLCFGSVKELYESVKMLFGSNESMSLSYHAFLGSYCSIRTTFKTEKSSVERINII